jgi:hypothetical protein
VVVAKHVVEAMVAEEAAAVTGLNGSSGGGLGTVHGDTSKAPDMTSDLKAAGKRPIAIMGLGGSSPPPPARAFTAPGGMLHRFFCRFFLLSHHSLCGFIDPCLCSPGQQT